MDVTPQLSQCFFQLFLDDKMPAWYQPILQIMEVREIQQQIKARISDSIFSYESCIVANDISRRFETDKLNEKNGVIQVTKWSRTVIKTNGATSVTFNIADYNVVSIDFPVIGNPQPHSGNPDNYRKLLVYQIQGKLIQQTPNEAENWGGGAATKRTCDSSPNDSKTETETEQSWTQKIMKDWGDRVFSIKGNEGSQGSCVLINNKNVLTAGHLSFTKDRKYNIEGNGVKFEVQCIKIHQKRDYAILHSDELEDKKFSKDQLSQATEFFIMGYPPIADDFAPAVTRGTIMGYAEDDTHLLGSPGSSRGFSGAPVFTQHGRLGGILIGGISGHSEMTNFRELFLSAAEQKYALILPICEIDKSDLNSKKEPKNNLEIAYFNEKLNQMQPPPQKKEKSGEHIHHHTSTQDLSLQIPQPQQNRQSFARISPAMSEGSTAGKLNSLISNLLSIRGSGQNSPAEEDGKASHSNSAMLERKNKRKMRTPTSTTEMTEIIYGDELEGELPEQSVDITFPCIQRFMEKSLRGDVGTQQDADQQPSPAVSDSQTSGSINGGHMEGAMMSPKKCDNCQVAKLDQTINVAKFHEQIQQIAAHISHISDSINEIEKKEGLLACACQLRNLLA